MKRKSAFIPIFFCSVFLAFTPSLAFNHLPRPLDPSVLLSETCELDEGNVIHDVLIQNVGLIEVTDYKWPSLYITVRIANEIKKYYITSGPDGRTDGQMSAMIKFAIQKRFSGELVSICVVTRGDEKRFIGFDSPYL